MLKDLEAAPRMRTALAGVRLVVTDVDGVHTDGTFLLGVGSNGERIEFYKFNTRDGIAVKECLRHDIHVVLLSGRKSPAVLDRANALGTEIRQGVGDKMAVVEELLSEHQLSWSEVLFIGDDIQDISLLRRAGFSVAPADAAPEAKAEANHVAELKGGEGVVREVLQALLEAKGLWEGIIARERTLG